MTHQSSYSCLLRTLQEAYSSIDSLQTQLLDMEVQLRQGKSILADLQQSSPAEIRRLQGQLKESKSSLADLQQNSSVEISRLQDQLRKAQRRAVSNADSGLQLQTLTSEVAQLRTDLGTKLSQAVTPLAGLPGTPMLERGLGTTVETSANVQSLTGIVTQLRSELDAAASETAEVVQAHAASAADAMAKLQGQLQQAEAESTVHTAELTRLRHELQESQSSVIRLEESMKREGEEHSAALQVSCSLSAARN